MGTVRFATIGTSGICERFLEALSEARGVEYVGTYSRDIARARDFGGRYGARLFFDDLRELASCPEVDAVYVASPNAAHARQNAQHRDDHDQNGTDRDHDPPEFTSFSFIIFCDQHRYRPLICLPEGDFFLLNKL